MKFWYIFFYFSALFVLCIDLTVAAMFYQPSVEWLMVPSNMLIQSSSNLQLSPITTQI